MKHYVMYGAFCLSCFLVGLGAPKLVEKYKDQFTQALTAQPYRPSKTQTAKETPQPKQDWKKKLAILKKNIVSNSPEDRQYIEFLFDQMATTITGRKRILKAPEKGLTFQKVNSTVIGADALYMSADKTCYVSNLHERTDLKLDKSDFCHPSKLFSHELLHEYQHRDGRFNFTKTGNLYKDFSVIRLTEIEAFLHDTIYEIDWKKQHPDHKLSLNAKFYISEIDRYKQQGQSDEAAERSAKTSFIKAVYSNCTDLEQGCNISAGLKKGINAWNIRYDLQTFTNMHKLQTNPTSIEEENKRADAIFAKYIEEMGVNLSSDYFAQMQKKCSNIQTNCITSIQSNNSKNYSIKRENDHFIVCEYAQKNNGKGPSFLLNLTSYDFGSRKDGLKVLCSQEGKIGAIQINKEGNNFATAVCDKNENINEMLINFSGIEVLSEFNGHQYPQVIGIAGKGYICNPKNGTLLAVKESGSSKLSRPTEKDEAYIKGVLGIIFQTKDILLEAKKEYSKHNIKPGQMLSNQRSND